MVIISLIYLVLALLFSQVLHFSRAFDEGYHLEYITFIKQNGHLPQTYAERAEIARADFPPLYHLLVTTVAAGVTLTESPNFKYFGDSFRYQTVDHQTEHVLSLDTEDFNWPYLGRFLVWQIGRWVSIGLSLTTLWLVFFTLSETPLKQYRAAPVMGAALLAFIPRYLILGSTLNDDNLLGLVAALYFWMLVKIINNPRRWWPFVLLGLLLGLSMTVKYTLILVPLEIIIISLWLASKHKLGWFWAGSRVALVGALALLSSAWWFGWNIWFLNTVAQDGWLAGLLRPIMAGGHDTTLNRISNIFSGGQLGLAELPANTQVGTFPQWVSTTFFSFWGVSDLTAWPWLSVLIYLAIALMLLVAGFGLWRVWYNAAPNRPWLLFFGLHIALFLVLPLIRFGLTRRLSVAAQGRHILIPAATALMALLVWGLAAVIPTRWHKASFSAIICLFAMWTGLHLYELNTTATIPLPLRSTAQAATWLENPSTAQFGETIALVSYTLTPQPEQGSLQLELAWRSLAYANENYLLQVELFDDDGQLVSHWSGYHGQGRLPTLAWDPDDTVFDRLSLPLPHLPAGNYQVALQILGQNGPLPLNGAADADDAAVVLKLPPITLPSASQFSLTTDKRYSLWPQQDQFRYPATLSIVTAADPALEAFQVRLVDAAGKPWSPTKSDHNIHTFIIGPDWPSGPYQIQLTAQDNVEYDGQTLFIENWWKRDFDVPPITVPVEANFANQVKFLGYDLPETAIKAGESFPLTLYWQAPAKLPPQADFTQFNHLHDSQGNLYGGYDRRPLENYSTLLWAAHEVVVDGYAVPIEADAPPGDYYLDVGYYLTVGQSAVNLPLVVDGQMTEQTSISIGPIKVLP